MSHKPAKERVSLAELEAEFQDMDARDRLETLLEFSEKMPKLPERFHAERDAGQNRIHECQSPVFLWVELVDGRVRIFADVPRNAPTVRGFVSMLQAALEGATPAEVLDIEPTLIQKFGLAEAIGMLRTRGLHAILHRLKTDVAAAAS